MHSLLINHNATTEPPWSELQKMSRQELEEQQSLTVFFDLPGENGRGFISFNSPSLDISAKDLDAIIQVCAWSLERRRAFHCSCADSPT